MPHGAREAVRKRRERAARRPPDTAERPPDAALGDVSRPPDTIEALRARLMDARQRHIDPMADVGQRSRVEAGAMSRPRHPPDAAPCPSGMFDLC